jgi:hypothetical protein
MAREGGGPRGPKSLEKKILARGWLGVVKEREMTAMVVVDGKKTQAGDRATRRCD